MSRDVDRLVVGCLLEPKLEVRRLHNEDYYERQGNRLEYYLRGRRLGQHRRAEEEKCYSIQWV